MTEASKNKGKSTGKSADTPDDPAPKASKPADDQPASTSEDEKFQGPERIYDFADSLADDAGKREDDYIVAARLETWVTFRLAQY